MAEAGIKVGKRHTLMHDGMCWVVVTHPTKGARSREDSKGKTSLVGHRNYYNHLGLALRSIYNSNLKGAKSIEELMLRTEDHFAQIMKVGKDIRSAVSEAEKKILDL